MFFFLLRERDVTVRLAGEFRQLQVGRKVGGRPRFKVSNQGIKDRLVRPVEGVGPSALNLRPGVALGARRLNGSVDRVFDRYGDARVGMDIKIPFEAEAFD